MQTGLYKLVFFFNKLLTVMQSRKPEGTYRFGLDSCKIVNSVRIVMPFAKVWNQTISFVH